MPEELIYLASPYSHDDPAVRERRFNEVCRVAADLMKIGKFVYSPIAHTHPIAQYGLPLDWGYWEKYDTLMLSKCDKLFVLMIPGWYESKGVQSEIKIAEKNGIPIYYIYFTEGESNNDHRPKLKQNVIEQAKRAYRRWLTKTTRR